MLAAAKPLHPADWTVLIGYFAVMLGIGAYFYRHMRGMKDYFSGGNQVPWWLAAGSFYMSGFSVFAFVTYSAIAYKHGLTGVSIMWSYIPGTLLCALVFAPRWRRARVDSPVEYLEARYNRSLRQVCAWQGIPVKIIDDALKIVAIGMFISASLGLDIMNCMLWSGIIMLAYTFMGGLWAVIVTDFIQFVVMGAAVLVLFVLALIRVGGIGGLVDGAPAGFFLPVTKEYNAVYFVAWPLLLAVSMCSVHWQIIQRFYCVPNEREARKMSLLVTGLYVVTPLIMFVPAMAARRFLPQDTDPNQIYATLCRTLLQPGLLGLMIAAMFAATMSMLSSDYNAAAAVMTNDVYRRLLRPNAGQRELVFAGRAATLLVGGLSLGIAMALADSDAKGLFDNMVTLFSVATAPVAVPMILGLLVRRLTGVSALAGFAGGLAVALTLFFSVKKPVPVGGVPIKPENVVLFAGLASTSLIMFVVSAIWPYTAAGAERVRPFLQRLDQPIGTLAQDAPAGRAAVSPFRVVGVSMAAIGAIVLAITPSVHGVTDIALNAGIGGVLLIGGAAMAWKSRTGRSDEEKRRTTAP